MITAAMCLLPLKVEKTDNIGLNKLILLTFS